MERITAKEIKALHTLNGQWQSEFALTHKDAFYPQLRKLMVNGLAEVKEAVNDWKWRITPLGVSLLKHWKRKERLERKKRRSEPPPKNHVKVA